MSIKTILALADGTENGGATLASAIKAARRFCAYLDVVDVKADPLAIARIITKQMLGILIPTMLETLFSLVAKSETAARQSVEARRQARESPLADRPRYLTGTPMLGDYLEQGMSELGLLLRRI
jgi:hypothetical protein